MTLPHVGVFQIRSDDEVARAASVRRLLSSVRGVDGISFSGRRILLNPNPSWLSSSVYGGVVVEVAAALGRRGATVLMAGTFGAAEEKPGVSPAASGATCKAGEPPWQTVDLNWRKSEKLRLGSRTYKLPSLIFEVDLVVNIACLFAEPRAQLAGAMYNMAGLVCGGNRPNCPTLPLAPERFNAAMVDLVSRIMPDLNILVMPGVLGGPDKGRRGRAQLLASADVVAVDTLAASLAGYDPLDIPAVRLAAESGLGIGWIEAITLEGDRPLAWNPGLSIQPGGSGSGHTGATSGALYDRRSFARVPAAFETAPVNPPVGVNCCPGGDSTSAPTPVATCVGEVSCDVCPQCVGSCPVLLN